MWGCSNMCIIYLCNIARDGSILDFHEIRKPFAIKYIHTPIICKILSNVKLELKYSNYIVFLTYFVVKHKSPYTFIMVKHSRFCFKGTVSLDTIK